jgi:hypothetical protein
MQPINTRKVKIDFTRPYPALRSKCIVGCIFNSFSFVITGESFSISGVSKRTDRRFSSIA